MSFGAGGMPLPTMAVQWLTPTSVSSAGGHQPGNSRSYNATMEMSETISRSIHRDQAISTPGEKSSNERLGLNPLFVEWLMGWPEGWTAFECSATELTRYKRRMRSALWQLGLPDDPPAQPSLFG